MNTISKYLIVFFFAVIAMLASCSDFLEENVYSQQFPEKFYTNAAEAEGAILGIVNTFSGNTNYQLLNMEEYVTDNVLTDAARVLKTDDNLQFSKKNVKATNSLIQSVYSTLYSGIYNCNTFIHYMEKTSWPGSKDAQRPQFIAEAYTLRALIYFKLVRLFGAVPLIVDVKDNTPQGPISIGRTPITDVYKQIVADLEKAKKLYIQEPARVPGFPGKILCRLLLAEVYLTMGGQPLNLGSPYLKLARAEADTLINAKAAGIVVPPFLPFQDVFKVANENRGEILFSAQNYGLSTGQVWAVSGLSYGALSFDLIREFDTSGPIDMTNSSRQIRNVNPNLAAYDITLYTDPNIFIDGRFYPTFWPYRAQWNANTKQLPNFNDPLAYLATPSLYTSQNINNSVFPGKLRSDYHFKGGTSAAYPHYDKKANIIMYRWAEAFLIFAEADNELNGPQPAAIAAIDKIRNRAALQHLPASQIATQQDFRDAIRKEWRLEFVSEGKHYYNLQRWGTLINEVNTFVDEYNGYNSSDPMTPLTQGKNEIFPIPFAEIDRTGFPQNHGY